MLKNLKKNSVFLKINTNNFLNTCLKHREPVFPESIIHGRDSTDSELALNDEQIKQSIDTAMSHYLQCSIPDIKQFMPLPMGDSMQEAVDRPPLRKSLRRSRKFHRLAGFDGGEEDASDESDKETDSPSGNYSLTL